MSSDTTANPEAPVAPSTAKEPEVKIVQEKVIIKTPETTPAPIIQTVEQEPPKKVRKPYTKREGVTYGNPKWKKGKTQNPKAIKSEKKEIKKIDSPKNNVVVEKPKGKGMFYLGLTLGAIAAIVGAYFLYQKIKEKILVDKQVKAVKEWYDGLPPEEKQNAQFLGQNQT